MMFCRRWRSVRVRSFVIRSLEKHYSAAAERSTQTEIQIHEFYQFQQSVPGSLAKTHNISIASHVASRIHSKLTEEERQEVNITPG